MVAFAIVLYAPVSVQGQTGEEELRVERVVARYARVLFKGQRMGFEDSGEEFMTPHPATGPSRVEYRTSGHTMALAREAGAEMVRLPDPSLCGSEIRPACIQTVVRIGVPVVTGDSATVWLYAYQAAYSEETDRQLLLVKRGFSWEVVREIQIRRAYSG